jgi:hypothetical protein
MLRITIHKDVAATRFALEGKLVGDWVSELEQCWLQAAAASSPIRVELNDVSFVDEAGQELLARMAANGAELSAADVLTRALVEEIRAGSFQRQ